MAAYMKGRFDFLGVQTPARRQATVPIMRAFTGHPLDAARELWALPARRIPVRRCQLVAAGEQTGCRPATCRHWKRWCRTNPGGTASDGLAVTHRQHRGTRAATGRPDRCPDPRPRLLAAAASPGYVQLHERNMDPLSKARKPMQARRFHLCLRCADEREFFIRKAIGLAALTPSTPARTRSPCAGFAATNREKLSGLSIAGSLESTS